MSLKTIKTKLNKTSALLGSHRFYIFVLAFFAFESIWIAFSALYPQAFDEDYHFGLIKVYSHYWLPFLTHQPPGANTFGAVTRDPSYLYHYLMSFPYRAIALFTHSQTLQVIAFRLIDVGFFGAGLILFRKILLRVGLSRSLANLSLLLFILIPIVPQLAAQVSYDDLLFPLVAWSCLLTFQITDELRKRQPSLRSFLTLLSVCLFASLVKYAFLPIFLTIAAFLLVVALRAYRHQFKKLSALLLADFKKQSLRAKIILPTLTLLALGMFLQRYGVNIVKYHDITPDCASVLSINDCKAYSAWYYNYSSHQQVLSHTVVPSYNLNVYTRQWLYWMWYRLFFAVNGASSNFISYPPLPLPGAAAAAAALAGIIAAIKWRRRLFHNNPYLVFVISASAIYLVVLFGKGYETYKYTAVLENMNGRYLLPVLPLLAAIAGLALSLAMRRFKTQKALAALLILVLFLQGGGLLTFILRSDESWYWPNHTVAKVNHAAQKVTNHVVIKNSKTQSSNLAPSFAD